MQKRFAEWGIKQGLKITFTRINYVTRSLPICWSRGRSSWCAGAAGSCQPLHHANYTHLDFQHLASVYDAAHPRANGGNNAFLPAFGAHLGAHLYLDDTLYDNRPVILRTEREALPLCKIIIRRCAASRMKICKPAPGGTGSGT